MSDQRLNIKSIQEYFKERENRLIEEIQRVELFKVERSEKPKFFITFPYPYMNGSLHLGHGYTSTRLDVYARFKRLKGYNVLYPWAWHWTGEAVYGTVHRIKENDEAVIMRLIKLDGVPLDEIDNLKDPVYFVKYFTKKNKPAVIRLGLSIDWSREFHTTSLHPLYDKFVKWQIKTLHKKGYIVKGSHPLVWCPVDKSPTGDHDRLEGEGVRPEEYTLVKFKYGERYLVAGTFRPETIYGATNLWINPDGNYVEAVVDDEVWIVSKEACEKLKHQMFKVKECRDVDVKSILGEYVEVPLVKRKIPVLPAKFVDTDMVTGVVYSVPAHAPYDYAALRDLKNDPTTPDVIKQIVQSIEPISIISVEGYGEYPAVEAVEKYGVKSQTDYENLDKATKEIYSAEFHKGFMKNNTGPISNLPVKEAKEVIKSILVEEGLGAKMYDLPEPVICRCTAKCIVKIIPDQWFLKYSDPGWKELAHKAVNNMQFYPSELRSLFNHYIDWYNDWPCTRKTGLGTSFPLDPEWIVETLTDSTIYNSFYIIAKYYNEGLINPEYITDSFFDYIFLGLGDIEEVSKENKVSTELLKKIRDDFIYWYPVDLRGSGKDLIGNHLTFFIFHHVAIFPEDKWPRGITANGFIKLEGKPMSKSKGIFMSLEKALDTFGADALRVSLLTLVDGLDDPDWSISWTWSVLNRLHNIENTLVKLWRNRVDVDNGFFDELILSRYRWLIKNVNDKLENMEIASAGRLIFFDFFEELRDYLFFVDNPSKKVVEEVVPGYIILMSMYSPFMAEDLWRNLLGKEGYVAYAEFPEIKEYNELHFMIKLYLEEIVDDIRKILEVIGSEDKKEIKIYVAGNDVWNLFKKIFKEEDGLNIKKIMKIAREWNLKDKRYLGGLGKFLSREWFGRYTKFRELLEQFDDSLEYDIIVKYLPKFAEKSGIKLRISVAKGVPENGGGKLPYPLYPAIVIM